MGSMYRQDLTALVVSVVLCLALDVWLYGL